jgi:hypothetical protein
LSTPSTFSLAVNIYLAPVTRLNNVSESAVESATESKIFIILFIVAPSA